MSPMPPSTLTMNADEIDVPIKNDDTKSSMSSVTNGSKSTSTSALVSLVKEQVKLVRNLTNANKSASEELQKIQEEKRRVEEEYKRMQEELRRNPSPPPAPPGGGGREHAPVATATALGAIPEERWSAGGSSAGGSAGGGGVGGGGGWTRFPPPRADGFADDGVGGGGAVAPPPTPSPLQASSVEVFDDGFGPRASAIPPSRTFGSDPAHGGAHRGAGQYDEWSTVVYPSARELGVPEAMPVQDIEAQIHPTSRGGAPPQSKSYPDIGRKSSLGSGGGGGGGSMSKGGPPPPPPAKTIPLATTDPAPPLVMPDRKVTCGSRFWASFSRMCTFFIPDFMICKEGAAVKQAWREKVATFLIAVLVSAALVGGFGFMPLFLCGEDNLYTWQDIYDQNDGVLMWHRESWTVIHGTIYNVKGFIDKHSGGSMGVVEYLGRDASKLFPRTPAADLPAFCRNTDYGMDNMTEAKCEGFTAVDEMLGTPCHSFATGSEGMERYMGRYYRGTLAHSMSSLSDTDMDWIVVKNTVYNVTGYTSGIKGGSDGGAPTGYLTPNLHKIIKNKLREDATKVFEAVYAPEVQDSYQRCLDEMFYAGEINAADNLGCSTFYMIMYVLLIIVALILVLQCLCSLLYVARRSRTLTRDMLDRHVMIMVPCYNEGDRELRKTINSVVQTEFPDDNKVLLIVADGIMTGKGEAISTPETVARILGFTMDQERDAAHFYKSIGASERNRAFVYHGVHKKGGRELKYVVVVKCGTTAERTTSNRPGNRGKRDSQLLLLGCLNRISYGRELCELDIAMCRALNDLEVSVEVLKYLMTIDADTRVHKDSMGQMVFSMEKDEKILALCGETRVDNKAQSWVTMIQVYEYYSSHHMKKAFESVFGCVTCLPGCFTMYRIKASDERPLIACDYVYGEYSRNDIESLHEKNLYHLGEDRMLTTLLLQFFSDMKLSFVPEAVCWTIVPHTFRILVSQRRRWINSTFHNMWELMKVNTMCGICFCSMKTVVIADMISVMILPASMVYAGYFVYLVFVEGEPMSETLFIVYGVIISCQVVVFLIRSRFDYIFWFLAYFLLGVPVFYFILPIYAFWHMDDLSWGQTRQVAAGQEKLKAAAKKVQDKTKAGAKKVAAPAGGGARRQSRGQSQKQSQKQQSPPPAAAGGKPTKSGAVKPEEAAAARSSRSRSAPAVRSGQPVGDRRKTGGGSKGRASSAPRVESGGGDRRAAAGRQSSRGRKSGGGGGKAPMTAIEEGEI